MRRLRQSQFARVFLVFAAVWFLAAALLQAGQLPVAKPAEVGLSAERLERLTRAMQEYVDQGKVAGLVTLIARKGTVPYLKAFGKLDLAKGSPMPANAIFRIASQTKAVTSVAVMMLQEEGKLLIDDPVAKYIPEFAGARVAVQAAEKDAKGFTTVPVKRPITIRDLLTHTAGYLLRQRSGPRALYGSRDLGLVPRRQADAHRRCHQKAGYAPLRRAAR